jgi:hypothetical protein
MDRVALLVFLAPALPFIIPVLIWVADVVSKIKTPAGNRGGGKEIN